MKSINFLKTRPPASIYSRSSGVSNHRPTEHIHAAERPEPSGRGTQFCSPKHLVERGPAIVVSGVDICTMEHQRSDALRVPIHRCLRAKGPRSHEVSQSNDSDDCRCRDLRPSA